MFSKNNNDGTASKKSKRLTHEEVEEAENALDDRLRDIAGSGDEFRAMYWPMDKWMEDKSAAEMLSVMIGRYPGLNWANPLSSQFNAMLSAVQNFEWFNGIRTSYDLGVVDFMRIVFMNWPELFSKKKYAPILSTAIVSVLTENGQL